MTNVPQNESRSLAAKACWPRFVKAKNQVFVHACKEIVRRENLVN